MRIYAGYVLSQGYSHLLPTRGLVQRTCVQWLNHFHSSDSRFLCGHQSWGFSSGMLPLRCYLDHLLTPGILKSTKYKNTVTLQVNILSSFPCKTKTKTPAQPTRTNPKSKMPTLLNLASARGKVWRLQMKPNKSKQILPLSVSCLK